MTRRIRGLTGWLALAALALPLPVAAQEGAPDAGAYLAARAAGQAGDFTAAATYFTRALRDDPANPVLLENAMAAWLGLGQTSTAVDLARLMQDAGYQSQIAAMLAMVGAAQEGDWSAVLSAPSQGLTVGPLIDALALAWAHAGNGDMNMALAAFDAVIATRGMMAFGLYHKALALAAAGDFEGADQILSLSPEEGMQRTRRAVLAHAQVLSQLSRNADAVALIDASFPGALDPALAQLRLRLAAGEPLPWTFVQDAGQGLSEVYYGVGITLRGEVDDASVLFHARAAQALNPDHTDAQLLVAQMLDRLEQYDLAQAAYAAVPPEDPSHVIAELGRAESLRRAGSPEVAIEVLGTLARAYPELAAVQTTLGDMQRRLRRDAEANAAYSRALELYPAGDPALVHVHYVRGITYFRLDDWPAAEADFRAALAINPDRPDVLNFLGYSLVERGERLEEALAMIETAVRAEPQNGAIVDSLGWALFRLGRHAEAVPHMERASALLPTDPVINDHLGDVYWAVGRLREAQFQWSRALSFAPEDPEAARIRRKIEVGLDAVLAEEGAPPLGAVAAGAQD